MILRKKGFSLLEILVASALSAGLGLAVAASISSASRVAKISLSKATSEQQIRDVVQISSRYIKAARPRGGCLSQGLNSSIVVFDIPLDQCPTAQVRDDPDGPIVFANYKKLEFYSYWKDCVNDDGNCQRASVYLDAPVKMLLEVVELVDTSKTNPGQLLRISKTKATDSSTFTNPDFIGQSPEVVREIVLIKPSNECPFSPSGGCQLYPSASIPFFTYYTLAGTETTNTKLIALVKLDPKVWVQMDKRTDSEWKEYGHPVFVPIAYKGFIG